MKLSFLSLSRIFEKRFFQPIVAFLALNFQTEYFQFFKLRFPFLAPRLLVEQHPLEGRPVANFIKNFWRNLPSQRCDHSGQYFKLFTAVIMPLAVYFSMILTELRRQRRNYSCKKLYNIGHRVKTHGNNDVNYAEKSFMKLTTGEEHTLIMFNTKMAFWGPQYNKHLSDAPLQGRPLALPTNIRLG